MRAGGDFFFDPDPGDQTAEDVLLIAGGVGINPLYSMINHVAHINSSPQGPYSGKVLLLYSARTCADLIFKVSGLLLPMFGCVCVCYYSICCEDLLWCSPREDFFSLSVCLSLSLSLKK